MKKLGQYIGEKKGMPTVSHKVKWLIGEITGKEGRKKGNRSIRRTRRALPI